MCDCACPRARTFTVPFVSSYVNDAKWQQSVDYLSSAISLTGCAILCALILFRTPKEMGKYKWLLFFFAIMDGLITLVLLISDFHLHTQSPDGFVGISNGPISFSNSAYHFWSLLIVFIMLNWYILPVSYCYRYLSLCHEQKLQRFTSKQSTVSICLFFVMIAGLLHWVTFSYAYVPGTAEYMNKMNQYWCDTDFGPMVNDRNHIDYTVDRIFILGTWQNHYKLITVYAIIILPLPLIYLFNLIISVLILRYLRQNRSYMSTATHNAHRRLLMALSVQSALPLITMVLPVCIFFACFAMNFASYELIETIRAVLSIGLAINPFFTMALIRPYKTALRDFFRSSFSSKNKKSAVVFLQ